MQTHTKTKMLRWFSCERTGNSPCCGNLALSSEPLSAHGRVRGLYLCGEIYWFAKQINGRRSIVSLETRGYAEAVQRAREIMERPELQPAQALLAEAERFLKYLIRGSVLLEEFIGELRLRAAADAERYAARGRAPGKRGRGP